MSSAPAAAGYALSPQQRRTWRILQRDLARVPFVRATFEIPRGFDLERLEGALAAAIERHESLRTICEPVPLLEYPVQVIHATHATARDVIGEGDESTWDDSGRCVEARLHAADDAPRMLTLRARALCADVTSLHVLASEIFSPQLAAAMPVPFRDVAAWQNEVVASAEAQPARDYWQAQLSANVMTWPLAAGRRQGTPWPERTIDLLLEDHARLDQIAAAADATREAVLLACCTLLLWRSTGQAAGIIGVARDGRSVPPLARAVGPLTRILPVHAACDSAMTFVDCVKRAAQQLRTTDLWADGFDWDLATTDPAPLFDACFDWTESRQSGGAILHDAWYAAEPARLQLSCVDHETAVAVRLRTDPVLSADYSELLARRLRTLFDVALRAADTPVTELDLVSDEERQCLHSFSHGREVQHTERLLHTPFAATVARLPDHTAVRSGSGAVSYAALDVLVSRLARRLQRRGVGPDCVVPLCLERSIELVVSILAVLRAGGAYLPLDPRHPHARLAEIIAESGSSIVLAAHGSSAAERLAADGLAVLDPAADEGDIHQQGPHPIALPHNLAYVLYTSGSTGRPKGVQIEHRAICNHMEWMRRQFPLAPGDRVLQKTAVTFDASVWEFHLPFWTGAELVLADPDLAPDAASLVSAVIEHGITVLQVVPTMLRMLADEARLRECTTLRAIFCGGELLPADLAETIESRLPHVALYNLYGPTEATIEATWATHRAGGGFTSVPIGRPIDHARAYVLDVRGRLQPVGAPGELFLGGRGLGRGYRNGPALTAQAFVPDPFGADGECLYRTGDLVRWLPDGQLEFLGRRDDQVKVRGFRVELAEIAAVLHEHAAVRQAVVIVRGEQDEQRLIAYLVADDEKPSLDDLRAHLSARLPEYMVPQAFVWLDRIPLTTSGKVAVRELPDPSAARPAMAREFVAPRTATEAVLARIWCELLGLERVGVHDNFFTLGGHSILLTQAVLRIREALHAPIPLVALLRHPTIATVAPLVEAAAIAQPGTSTRESSLVTIRSDGAGPPLFLVHPIGGGLAAYLDLARHLKSDCPIHAFQATFSFDDAGAEADVGRLEDVAGRYADAVQRLQESGPYWVGGWSYGGVLAFAMAEELMRRGEAVASVLLFDSWPPGPEVMIVDDSALALGLARQLAAQARVTFDLTWQECASIPSASRLDFILEQIQQAGLLPGFTRVKMDRMLAAYRHRRALAEAYVPPRLPVTLALFRVPAFDPDIERSIHASVVHEPAHGWGRYTTRAIDTIDVPGTHWSLFEEPHIASLASALDAYLAACRDAHLPRHGAPMAASPPLARSES